MTTKSSTTTVGDFLLQEESAIRCRESVAITNPTAAAYTAPVGSPIKSDGTIALATEEASVVGFTLEEVVLAASGTSASKVGYIARDATINEAKIPDDDPAGTSYTMATILSTAAALGIIARYEPTKSSTQTN